MSTSTEQAPQIADLDWPKFEALGRDVYRSGLWASYGDVAAVVGSTGRGIAKATWNMRESRLATWYGSHYGGEEREAAWFAEYGDKGALDTAFGYPRDRRTMRPARLRLSEAELRVLIGDHASTTPDRLSVVTKLHERLGTLLAYVQLHVRDGIDPILWEAATYLANRITELEP